ncbi:MAG: hypothetical protein AB201_00800 [Parcubacteria bacterium C7867-006]|nr:MAG: hypothetical protein AB201_00800 [Parcubacteria bacterium C7867-006]
MEKETKKKFYKKWWFWGIVVIVLAVIGSNGNTSPQKVGENTSTSNKVVEKSTTFKVGDQIKLGNSIVTVNKVEYSQGGQYTKPAEGNEWVNLNVTIENTGSSQQYVTTLGQMFIRDAEKNSYQVAVTNKAMENPGFGLDGSVIAQSKRTGWVGFEIKKGATGLQFQYNGSMFGGKSALVDLGR